METGERTEGCIRSTCYLSNQPSIDANSASSQSSLRSMQGVNHQVPYQSRHFESASCHIGGSFAKTAQYFVGASSHEDFYSHDQSGLVTAPSRPSIESGVFPFVCGICSLQFNRVLEYLSHFKTHNYQNISQENIHICGTLTESLIHTLGTVKSGNFFTCGQCALPLPSLCLLHEHLVFVEKAVSYTVNIRTRVTENISFSYNETSYHVNNHKPTYISSEKNEAVAEPVFYDGGMQDSIHQKLIPDHPASTCSGIVQVMDNTSDHIRKSHKDVMHGQRTTVEDVTGTHNSGPEKTGAIHGNSSYSVIPATDLPEYIYPSKHVKCIPENTSNFKTCSVPHMPTTIDTSYTDVSSVDEISTVAPVVTEKDDTLCETVDNICKDGVKTKKHLEDTNHESLHHDINIPSCHTRRSARLKIFKEKNCINSTEKTSIEAISTKEAQPDQDKADKTSDDESEDEYVFRERKFDDPKRERRRLMMIKYQKNYRERKRLKALGVWQTKQEAKRKTLYEATSTTELEKKVTADAKVPCDVCGQMFKKKNLKRHSETHSTDSAFQCDICFKTFKTKGYLYGHKLHHQTVRDLICDHCGKAFNNGPNLRQHLKTHVKPRSLQCPVCPKMFRRNYVLKDHIRRHSEAKPHSCSVCGRTFKIAQEVNRHMLVHSESRPHVCQLCNRGFKCRSNLIKHKKIHGK